MKISYNWPGQPAPMLNTSGFTIERACVEYLHLR
jgi:hypothetical protein